MPRFLQRWRGTPKNIPANQQHISIPAHSSSGNQAPSIFLIDQRIHPDLDSLLAQDGGVDRTRHSFDIVVVPRTNGHRTGRPATSPEFVPLRPSTRRRSKPRLQPVDPNENIQEPSQHSEPSFSVSNTSIDRIRNTSGGTFGRPMKYTPRTGTSKRPTSTPTTPGSQYCASTPRSCSDVSNQAYDHQSVQSSLNTFGNPSPASYRKLHASSEILPPMPPLNHPAFFTDTTKSNLQAKQEAPSPLSKDNSVSLKLTRHPYSFPSLPERGREFMGNQNRKRSRTHSRSKPTDAGSHRHRTPALHSSSPRHKRSPSSSSSRRMSAEFSAVRASSTSHSNSFLGSWEVDVTKEMVRISLGLQKAEQASPDTQQVTGEHSQFRQARGHGQSTRKSSLGSPFLFQHAHTQNIPVTSLNTKTRSYLEDSTGLDSMSKSVSRPPARGKSSSPGRIRTPSSPSQKLNTVPYPASGAPSTSLLPPPSLSFTSPTPDASPIYPIQRPPFKESSAEEPLISVLRVPATPPAARTTSMSSHKGKRKADEAGVEDGGTPPKEPKEPRATFAIEPRPHRASANSGSTRAPSSYHRKRVRLSTMPESRPGSRASGDIQNAGTTGSWSSKASKGSGYPASQQGHRVPPPVHQPPQRTPSRRSLSQASIPMSALISPHAPSVARSSTFHMRDPRKPAPIQTTPWSLSFPDGDRAANSRWSNWIERGGSPLHAWLFFIGFVIFPTWWAASFTGIPKTRHLGGDEREKGVVLDDPQVEFDAKSWRTRCRIMAIVSIFTYIPFIVLVAIFAS